MSHEHDTIDPSEVLSETEVLEHEHHEHVTPFWPMLWVLVTLLVLTALTVWTSNIKIIPIGNTDLYIGATPHIVLALVIAVVKAVLVGMYFMHLKYDKPMNTVVVGATIFAVLLFIGLTLADLSSRQFEDRRQMQKIIAGGNGHLEPGGRINREGVGVVERSRQNYQLKHANDPPAEDPEPDQGH